MRFALALFFLILFASSSFAIVDTGLLPAERSLAYYLMPASNMQNISSGLVYNQKSTDGFDTEILYTSYRSVYLLTSNITQINVHKKHSILRVGPVNLDAVAGVGYIYSPSLGGGLTLDLGGIASAVLPNTAAIGIPLYFNIFSDGFSMNASPCLSYKPGFLGNYEIFGGFNIAANIIGNPTDGSGTARINNYFIAGARSGI